MKQKNRTSFSQYYDEKSLKKEISDASIALIVMGFILIFAAFLRWLVSVGFAQILSAAAIALGFALIVIGAFFTKNVLPVTRKVFAIFNKIGAFVIRGLLAPVYALTYITTFWYAGIKRRDYQFFEWDGSPPAESTFFEKENAAILNKKRAFGVIGSIFSGISSHKIYILFPLVIILLLIGLVFFFISSSTVFSFIYTFV
ncbi:MAG: hypothetical protein IJS90_04930 [Clostridia bacterium]|nr:hypothetical protein [Clostridia bacterium]